MFLSLVSGSSGNCSLISDGKTTVLCDCGLGIRRLEELLKSIGISPDNLSAILITHEHSDHIKGAGVVSKKYGLPVFATEQTHNAMKNCGISGSDGAMLSAVRSDAYVKTQLSNLSEAPMKILVFISGYNDGVMESVDLKLCNIAAGDEFTIDTASNTISLDPEKEYDRIQLRILDGESGYPLIEARELKTTE